MKTNSILSFLLGAITVILIAATTDAVQIVRPEPPKETLVEIMESDHARLPWVKDFIQRKASEGYTLKSISFVTDASGLNGTQRAFIVLERY